MADWGIRTNSPGMSGDEWSGYERLLELRRLIADLNGIAKERFTYHLDSLEDMILAMPTRRLVKASQGQGKDDA